MTVPSGDRPPAAARTRAPQPDSLADVLDRVLDKGVVIAGDIRVNLLDIELLTIKLRLLIASVDKAREMGIDWWEHDETLSPGRAAGRRDGDLRDIDERLQRLERALLPSDAARSDSAESGDAESGDAAEPGDAEPARARRRATSGTRAPEAEDGG